MLGVQDPETLQGQSLKNFDLTEYRLVISDLAVHIYQCLVKVEQDRMQPMIGKKILEIISRTLCVPYTERTLTFAVEHIHTYVHISSCLYAKEIIA